MVFFGSVYSGGTSSNGALALLVITIVGFRKVFRSWLSDVWPAIMSKEEGSSSERPEVIGSKALLFSVCFRLAKSRSDWLLERNPPPRDVTNFLPGANCFEVEPLDGSGLDNRRPELSTRVNRPGVMIRVDA